MSEMEKFYASLLTFLIAIIVSSFDYSEEIFDKLQ